MSAAEPGRYCKDRHLLHRKKNHAYLSDICKPSTRKHDVNAYALLGALKHQPEGLRSNAKPLPALPKSEYATKSEIIRFIEASRHKLSMNAFALA